MNRDARFALSQELEAKQPLLDQLHALATDDPDFLTDVLEGETNLLELIAALDASIIDDETLVDGANPRIGGLIRTSDECYSPGREMAVERRGRFLASWRRDDPTSSSGGKVHRPRVAMDAANVTIFASQRADQATKNRETVTTADQIIGQRGKSLGPIF
jgi:hypothetical protein